MNPDSQDDRQTGAEHDRSARTDYLFIVRIWQEPSSLLPPGQWRGSVEHVPAQTAPGQPGSRPEHDPRPRRYFLTLAELSAFIDGQIGAQDRTNQEPPAANTSGRV